MPEQKRKTHTSNEVKRRYNNKVYATVSAELPKELVAQFKELCKAQGVSQASVIKSALEAYISNNKK